MPSRCSNTRRASAARRRATTSTPCSRACGAARFEKRTRPRCRGSRRRSGKLWKPATRRSRALRDGELAGAKATAAERERCDREVAAKLRADDADADRARTQRMLEADRKLAADLAAGDYDAK